MGGQATPPGEWLGRVVVGTPTASPPTVCSVRPAGLESLLHWQIHLSVLILGQRAALWSLHGGIRSVSLSMTPPLPPVEQEAAESQQDQDDAGHQQVDNKPGHLGVGGLSGLPVMACISQRNGVKTGWGPGCPLSGSSSFQLCRAPPVPGAPLALQLPLGQHTAPGMASRKPWLSRKGGTAEALRAQ